MISSVAFATKFTSFWLECLPKGYFFVQDVNRRSKVFCPPLSSKTNPKRHSDINELGFRLFAASINNSSLFTSKELIDEKIVEICDLSENRALGSKAYRIDAKVIRKAERVEAIKIGRSLRAFVAQHTAGREVIDQENGRDIMAALRESLGLSLDQSAIGDEFGEGDMVQRRKVTMTVSPHFPGCGFVDESEGDLLIGNTLYEIKSADRNFRLVDFRQVLVYLALNTSARTYDIRSVGLINPRTGDYFEIKVDEFARSISGKHSTELFSEVISFVSGGGVSR